VQPLQPQRDGGDLVGLAPDRLLAEHEPLAGGPGADDAQRVVLAAPRPARGLAVHGDDVGFVLARALDPSGEAGAEQVGGEGVDDVVQRVVRGDAASERQRAAQEGELLPAPEPVSTKCSAPAGVAQSTSSITSGRGGAPCPADGGQ